VSRALSARLCTAACVPGLSLSMLKRAARDVRGCVVDARTGLAAFWWEPRAGGGDARPAAPDQRRALHGWLR
jgi:hypothetical protein